MKDGKAVRELVMIAREITAGYWESGSLRLSGKVSGEFDFSVTNATSAHLASSRSQVIQFRDRDWHCSIHVSLKGGRWVSTSTYIKEMNDPKNFLKDAPRTFKSKIETAMIDAFSDYHRDNPEITNVAEIKTINHKIKFLEGKKSDLQGELKSVNGEIRENRKRLEELGG